MATELQISIMATLSAYRHPDDKLTKDMDIPRPRAFNHVSTTNWHPYALSLLPVVMSDVHALELSGYICEVLNSTTENFPWVEVKIGRPKIKSSTLKKRKEEVEDLSIFDNEGFDIFGGRYDDKGNLRVLNKEAVEEKVVVEEIVEVADAVLEFHGETTVLQWHYDLSRLFFPMTKDIRLGWRHNLYDVGINKIYQAILAPSAQDYIDLIYLNQYGIPLWELIWGAEGKTGISALDLADQIERYSYIAVNDFPEHFTSVLGDGFEIQQIYSHLFNAVTTAQNAIETLPQEDAGMLYGNGDHTKKKGVISAMAGAYPRVQCHDVVCWPIFPDIVTQDIKALSRVGESVISSKLGLSAAVYIYANSAHDDKSRLETLRHVAEAIGGNKEIAYLDLSELAHRFSVVRNYAITLNDAEDARDTLTEQFDAIYQEPEHAKARFRVLYEVKTIEEIIALVEKDPASLAPLKKKGSFSKELLYAMQTYREKVDAFLEAREQRNAIYQQTNTDDEGDIAMHLDDAIKASGIPNHSENAYILADRVREAIRYLEGQNLESKLNKTVQLAA